jgi:hypothetical protein
MGTCVSKPKNNIKTVQALKTSSLSFLQKSLVSSIHTLQHLNNTCTREIQNLIKNHKTQLLVLLKLKQLYIKQKQKSIQNLLFQIDQIQETPSNLAKNQIEIQKAAYLIEKDLKSNPIFSENFKNLEENPDEQFKLYRIFEICIKNFKTIEYEAENEVNIHKAQIESGAVIRYRYIAE